MPPRSSSFTDTPLLRVSRPVSACSRCRAAKVKCDGKLPACTACEKAGRENECSSANDQFARGKERSYVAALELRIEKLEKRLAYARSRKASVALHDPDAPPAIEPSRKDSLAFIRAAILRKAARNRENSDVNSLVSDFGYLSVSATTRDFEPSEVNLTFARVVLAASTNDPVPEPRTSTLPPEQTARDLVKFYQSSFLALYPAFSSSSLTIIVDSLYQESPRPLTSPQYWLFWMVLAVASAARSRSKSDQNYQDALEYVARALPHADRALMPGYLTQIQSLFLLTQYAMLDPAHFDSWNLIGFTARAVVDLGLHQDPPNMSSMDQEDLDARRRVFYCVYALDRAISMVHARAFSFYDDAISVELPSPNTDKDSDRPPPDPSVPLFKLRQLQSGWYQTLVQGDPDDPLSDGTAFIWQKCLEMREWAESLPTDLPAAVRERFELELHYSYVYCIAPSARVPQLTAHGRKLIFEHAIMYIDKVYEMAKASRDSAFSTYHDALRAFFMGSQFVAVLRDAADTVLSNTRTPASFYVQGQGQIPPPPLPSRNDRNSVDNLQRSLQCLERVKLTLQVYGERWENALGLKGTFEVMSAEVLENLKARRVMRDMGATGVDHPLVQQLQPQQHMTFVSGPNPAMQQPSMPQQHPVPPAYQGQDPRWMNVDLTRIVHGGHHSG